MAKFTIFDRQRKIKGIHFGLRENGGESEEQKKKKTKCAAN